MALGTARWWRSLLLVSIVSLERGRSDDGIHIVECRERDEICTCNKKAKICSFTLEVRELQTFTSYKFEEREESTIGSPGDTYFINNIGFNPSLPPPRDDSIPDYGPCWRRNVKKVEEFTLMNCTVPVTADGRTYRPYFAVNGRIPGPTLIVSEGQTVRVDVHNHLRDDGVTINWHGITQQGTPWMDGVGYLSQSPIIPGGSFQYEFKASPAGTHWYHSHVGAQRTDGLFGAFIVREKSSTLEEVRKVIGMFEDVPGTHTLTLLDFQQEKSQTLFNRMRSGLGFYHNKPLQQVPTQKDSLATSETLTTDQTEVGPIPYWSGLINGKGRYDSNTYSLLSVFSVKPNMAYRFRLVGAQSLYAYKVEVVGHKLTVIATDGHFIEPVEVDYIIIHAGERYDFILNTAQTPGNYLIRAQTLEVANPQDNPNEYEFLDHFAEAILHYESPGVPEPDPTTFYARTVNDNRECAQSSRCRAINCPFKEFPGGLNIDCIHLTQLRALLPSKDNELPSRRMKKKCKDCLHYFNFGFSPDSAAGAINGRVFKPPPVPYQAHPGSFKPDRKNKEHGICKNCRVENDNTVRGCTDCVNVATIADGKRHTKGKEETVMVVLSAVGNDVDTNRADFSHPVHLHGHSFYIVHIGHGHYHHGALMTNSPDVQCDQPYCLKPQWRNGTEPDFTKSSKKDKLDKLTIRKDTVIVPAGGYVVIAFKADNPGYWLLHCQIERHHLDGMALILQEYPESQHPPLPPKLRDIAEPYWNRQEKVSLGLTIGLALLNLVLGLGTGLMGMNCIHCVRAKHKARKKRKKKKGQQPQNKLSEEERLLGEQTSKNM